tara:strand:- start:3266 stop:4693 length:1428 start_codon:yes stop_codon:yes gene_type:complete
MDKYNRLGKNTLLIFIGNFGSKIITFLLLPFYVKWLSIEEYGMVDLIWVYSLFLFQIISLCVSEAVFVYPKDKGKEEQANYYSSGFLYTMFAFVIGAVFFLIFLLTLKGLDIKNSFTDYAWSIYFIIFFVFTHTYNQQFSRSIDKVKQYAISGILVTSFLAFFSFLLMPTYGVLGFVYANIIAYSLSTIYLFIYAKIYKFFSFKYIKYSSIKSMYLYSIPLVPNTVMWWLTNAMSKPVIEYFCGVNKVGLYAVGHKLPSVIYMVFSVFLFSWQITAFEEFNKKNYSEFYNKILRLLFFVLILISCFLSIFSKSLVLFITNLEYLESWKLIPIISLGVVFASLSGFVGVNFSVTKQSKYYFYSSLWGGGVSVLLNLILIPFFGVMGAAFASLVAYIAMTFSRIKYSWSIVKINDIRNYMLLILVNIFVIISVFVFEELIINITILVILLGFFIIINKQYISDFKSMKKYVINLISK